MSDWVQVFETISEAGFTVSFAVDEARLYIVTAVNERTGQRFTVRRADPYVAACEVAGRAGVRLDDVSRRTRPKFFVRTMTDFDEDEPLTPDKQLLSDMQFQLDEAFHRDPSIGAMNRIYRRLRTGRPEIDKGLRNYIGLLYILAKVRAVRLRPQGEPAPCSRTTKTDH